MFNKWNEPGGYRQVLDISLPLVISMGSISLMLFTDRLFLSRYSLDAIAASMPAGTASFLFVSFFMGVVGYVNVFVAQYTGSGEREKVGASVWQGLYFTFGASLILASLYFIAGPLFDLAGHSPGVRRLEVIYFRILILGAGPVVLSPALGSFFTGRGLTRVVMFANVAGAGVNIPLDYCLINGVGPFPELGIIGAGLATVIGYLVIAGLLVYLVFNRENDEQFGILRQRGFQRALFGRMMRYGLPNGVQFFIDLFSFTAFIFIVGRLGKQVLAAANIVFSISLLAFLPLVGFGLGLSVLVGQALGRNNPQEAERATSSTLHVTFLYMVAVVLVFILAPEWLMNLFRSRDPSQSDYRSILKIGLVLLRFVAVYSLFDVLFIVYSAAIKGAGDTRFVMWTIGFLSTGIMVIPVYILVIHLGAGIYPTWVALTAYVCVGGIVFWRRFSKGKWKDMRVIERSESPPAEQETSGRPLEGV
jgi:MATE family multidrug resistance protein